MSQVFVTAPRREVRIFRSCAGQDGSVSEDSPRDRARAVHDEMAGLQRQAGGATASLRARRRARRRRLAIRRSLRVALLLVVVFAIGVLSIDAWGVRTTVVDVVRYDVIDPLQGR